MTTNTGGCSITYMSTACQSLIILTEKNHILHLYNKALEKSVLLLIMEKPKK